MAKALALPLPMYDLRLVLTVPARIRLPPIVVVAALAALLASGACPSPPTGPPIGKLPSITSSNPEAERGIAQARALARAGKNAEAEASYRRFLQEHGRDPLVPIAWLELGKLLLARDANLEAYSMFDRVAAHENAAVAEQGRFYGAVADHRLGRHERAIGTLRDMVGRTIDPADTALLLRTLAKALVATADYAGAVTMLDRLYAEAVPEKERRAAKAEIANLVDEKASPDEIRDLYRDLPSDGVAWPHVLRRALRDADAQQDLERVRSLLEVVREQGIEVDDELALIATRAEREGHESPQVIGAVLPLSGRARKVGELALRGLMLSAGLPPKEPLPPGAPQLVFRDDGGDPLRAAEAIDELVSVHRAIAIIGPLDARAAEVAAERAQQLGVPLLTLSPAARLEASDSVVFRMAATAKAEVDALVNHARSKGAQRIAALLPEGSFGDAMQATLADVVPARQGELVHVERYASDTTSFREHTEALAKRSFDALYVADRAKRLALIAPALAASGIWSSKQNAETGRAVMLLAPSLAFDAQLPRTSGRYLQDAVFSVPFDAAVATEAGTAFSERFQAQFGEPPDAFAAFAYDAYRLARRAVDGGARTRADLAEALLRVRADDLAGASRGMGPTREPLRPTRLVRLAGDVFVPVQ